MRPQSLSKNAAADQLPRHCLPYPTRIFFRVQPRPPMTIPQAFALAVQHHQAGRLGDAEQLYRQILAAQPNHADALHHLGVVVHQTGHHALAIEWIQQAIALAPGNSAAHANLGGAYRSVGRIAEAMACYRRAIQLNPQYALAYYNLGNVFREQGQFHEAIATYRQALQCNPNHADTHNNLGMALAELDELEGAVVAYRQAIRLKPDYAEAQSNLGVALKVLCRFDEAVTAYQQALALKPELAEVHNNLGNALKDRGQLDEAIAAYRRALLFKPDFSGVHSNLIYTLPLHPHEDNSTILEEQKRWNRQIGDPLKQSIRPHHNHPDPERRLKIGYVSPDFHFHAAAFFLVPLLSAHDHQQYEIICYATDRRADAVTERLRKSADTWRDVHALSDAQLAECIRNDGIDLLVDLAMHTTDNSLPTFARKPAPVQISWLAYAGSTGVEAIDYRLTDSQIDPPGFDEDGLGGKPMRLPESWCCYEPIAAFPIVNALPARQIGEVTFGSLNQFCKLNDALLRSWAHLLKAVPRSRLLIVCPEGQARERTLAVFTALGIAPDRLEFVGLCSWPDYVALFGRIDIALDSFPCNGMTTTCHALNMGVPVVTRSGLTAVSRAGSSLLHTIGLTGWITRSEEDYIRVAAQWAGDLEALAELRAALRQRMQASPLMDPPRFARNMEAAYRAMWRRWCAKGGRRVT